MIQLYENIRKRRNELRITQTKLAELTGYADKSMIAKIEKGLVDLPQSKIKLFAEALNMSPIELMGEDSNVERYDEMLEEAISFIEKAGLSVPFVNDAPFVVILDKKNDLICFGDESELIIFIEQKKINKTLTISDLFSRLQPILTSQERRLIPNYRAADPGTQAAVRKLLDIPEEENDDLLPVAARGHEGATPEELEEDMKIAEEDD